MKAFLSNKIDLNQEKITADNKAMMDKIAARVDRTDSDLTSFKVPTPTGLADRGPDEQRTVPD